MKNLSAIDITRAITQNFGDQSYGVRKTYPLDQIRSNQSRNQKPVLLKNLRLRSNFILLITL
jgi:hypothetical protein